MPALAVIAVTHFLIDHYRLARHVAFAKNKLTDWPLRWDDCKATGFPVNMPERQAFFLMLVIDNTMHLAINFAALRWL